MKKIEAAVNELTYRGLRELQQRMQRATGEPRIAYGQLIDVMVWQYLTMDDKQLSALWEELIDPNEK